MKLQAIHGLVLAGSVLATAATFSAIVRAQGENFKTTAKKLDPKMFDPIEVLKRRVDATEKSILDLRAQNKELQEQLGETRKDLADLRTQFNKLNFDFYRPGGQIGLKLKLTQKAQFDRLPGTAYLTYYER